jgi:hypothetical protein
LDFRINIFKFCLDIVKEEGYTSSMFEKKEKLNKLISTCPVCGGQLYVTHLKCSDCQSELTGSFVGNEFSRLPEDKLEFLRVFLACRGNLKEVEAALSISYPTVRGRLDQLLASLELHPREEAAPVEGEHGRVAVLDALSRGELSLEEAERRLRG